MVCVCVYCSVTMHTYPSSLEDNRFDSRQFRNLGGKLNYRVKVGHIA